MLRRHCDICGEDTDLALDRPNWSCDNCEMGSGWRVVDGDADDVRRLQGALVAIVDDLLTTRTDIGAGVFPALAQNHAVDEQLLDLLVMLFDHVFLQYEGSSKNPTSLAAKIDAYASAGIVTPVRLSIKHGYTRPLANELDLYDLGRSSLDDAGFTEIPFDMAVQILAEYHTAHDVRRSPLAFSESMNQWLSSNFDNAAPPLLLNRINGLSVICDILGASLVTDSRLATVRRFKHEEDITVAIGGKNVVLEMIEWRDALFTAIPRFQGPEEMLAFRAAASRRAFLNDVVDGYCMEYSGETRSAIESVSTMIKEQLALAQSIATSTYQTKSMVLTGLVSSIGNLVAGRAGALLAGIGAVGVTLAGAWLDKRRVAPWTSFFVRGAADKQPSSQGHGA